MNSKGCDKMVLSGIPTKARRKNAISQCRAKSAPVSRISTEKLERSPFALPLATNFRELVSQLPSNVPSSLAKGIITGAEDSGTKKKENPGPGKVKIMLRVCRDSSLESPSGQEYLRVDENQKHLSVFVPSHPKERNTALAPKVYAFDAVFTEKNSLEEISSASLVEVIQAVLQGADGAVFCYGQSNLGKSFVLFGSDLPQSQQIGIVPCAINWMYRCIDELKTKHNSRIFVRVSAIEVYGRSEKLKDLLVECCEDGPKIATISIKDDPLLGTQIQNISEISANTAEKAAYLLDVALTSRSCNRLKKPAEARRHSHLFWTLHVYQHKLENKGDVGVSGGRSRLHFIDLGSCERTLVKTTNSLALSYSSLGHVIMSIVNNSKHVPFKESKLTRVLREHLGNVNCRAVMIAHVSRDVAHYSDTLSTIQTASRIHRVLKKKTKVFHDGSNRAISSHFQKAKYLKFKDDENIGSSSGLEYTSGSELSCDTVVYVNHKGVPMSDRDLTDNEGPPDAILPFEVKPFIPLVIPVAESSIEDGEMVYNIARAQVSKLAPDYKGQQSSLNTNSNNGKLNGIKNSAPNEMKSLKERATGHLMQEAPALKPENKVIRSQYVSKLAKPSKGVLQTSTSQSPSTVASPLGKSYSSKKIANNIASSTLHLKSNVHSTSNGSGVAKNKMFVTKTGTLTPVKPPRHSVTKAQKHELKETKIPKPHTAQSSLPRRSLSATATRRLRSEKIFNSSAKSRDISKNVDNQCASQANNAQKTSFSNMNSNKGSDSSLLSQHSEAEKLSNDGKTTCAINHLNISSTDELVNKNSSEQLPYQIERPDPIGCAFDYESTKLQTSADGIFNPTYSSMEVLSKQHLRTRPDSMIVNVDDGDTCGLADITEDNDAVDVNFYCLTFTTRNPLIPLSKSKFTQQIRNNIKRKSLTEASKSEIKQAICHLKNGTSEERFEYDRVYEVTNQTLHSESTNKSRQISPHIDCDYNANNVFIKGQKIDVELGHKNEVETPFSATAFLKNSKFLATMDEAHSAFKHPIKVGSSCLEEDDNFVKEARIKEMPKLKCDYALSTSVRSTSAEGSLDRVSNSKYSTNSLYNSPHHEVCLYDSNSLAISYVNTKHSYSSSSDSASRSSTSSPSTCKRDDLFRSSNLKRSSKPVVMSKSTSKEGARLTLVKKLKHTGKQTLELLITNENDTTGVKLSPTHDLLHPPNTLSIIEKPQCSKSVQNMDKSSVAISSPKKFKWSGLKRFGGKNNTKDSGQHATRNTTSQKSKASLVSKILPNRAKISTNCKKSCNENTISSKSSKRSQNQTKHQSKACSAPNSFPRSNLGVCQSLSHHTTKNATNEIQLPIDQVQDEYSTASFQKGKIQRNKSNGSGSSSTSRFGFSKRSKYK